MRKSLRAELAVVNKRYQELKVILEKRGGNPKLLARLNKIRRQHHQKLLDKHCDGLMKLNRDGQI